MKYQIRCAIFTLAFCTFHAKILRNNALMTKMISHFAYDNNISSETNRELDKEIHHKPRDRQRWREKPINREKEEIHEKLEERDPIDERHKRPVKVLNLMQNVLCRNFPSIPCKIIMDDPALSKLIEKSIQQIATKKRLIGGRKEEEKKIHSIEHVNIRKRQNTEQPQTTTVASQRPRGFKPLTTVYPVINSEELSNFLEVSNTGYFNEDQREKKMKKKKKFTEKQVKNHWSHEGPSKNKIKKEHKDSKRGTELFTGRKKMRKFYPHKIKYKDKTIDGVNYREDVEKMSMSAEPENGGIVGLYPPRNLKYKFGLSDTPVWRIDYEKHGVPSLNMFEFDDVRRKIETGLMRAEGGADHSIVRKDVLHPDVYLKKIIRKPSNIHSSIMD
ncbi:hypothetical protein NE865_15500 [Phthorimaea operculella]|nr:hypothetical protein NE865_15500 [Phthorimaea operculella]